MPSLLLPRFLLPEMSDKKSPPHKEKPNVKLQFVYLQEKPFIVRSPLPDEKGMKRKLLSPVSPTNDDDDRKTPIKRKRGSVSLESSPIMGHQNVAKTPGTGSRSVPKSERQQLAMIMRMEDESTHGVLPVPEHDTTAKSPSPTPVQPVKKTPLDKKVHKRNERGELPIHLAAIKGDVKLLKKLIKAGADVNVADFAGWTPLHEASNRGWLYVAKQLLKAGANVNVQGLENDTPLHDASINGHRKLVELLLKHGANPLQANSKGKTPLDVAASQEMVKILKREIISSGSDSSSIDDTRSPMSQDSINSMKDDERSLDMDELNNRSESNSSAGGTNNRRMSMPKSPENKLASPRLCLKFQRDNHGNISQKFKDSKEPLYKSYSVTNVSVESSIDQMFSPVDSPASSADSDAMYNPNLEGLVLNKSKLIINMENPVRAQSPVGLSHMEPIFGHVNPRELFPSNPGVVNGRRTLENNNHQAVLNSVRDSISDNGHNSVVLKHMETMPFLPSAQSSVSKNDNLELPELAIPSASSLTSSSTTTLSSSLLPVMACSASQVFVNSESAGCNSVTSSSSLNCVSDGDTGLHLSMVTSTTGSNNLSLVTNSVEKDKEASAATSVLSNSTSLHSGSVNSNVGTNNSLTMNVGESIAVTNLKWELRSAASPKMDDNSSSLSQQKSDSSFFSAGSPHKSEKEKDSKSDKESRPSTPKVPPLKIIIPTKSQASSSTDSNEGLKLVVTNVKSALPYVINPYLDQGREAEPMEPGKFMAQAQTWDDNTMGMLGREQQPEWQQGNFTNSVINHNNNTNDSIDGDHRSTELEIMDSDHADSSRAQQNRLNNEQEDKLSDSDSSKRDDKKDEPTQRVLRSAVRSQQTDSVVKPPKQKTVDKTEKNSNGETLSVTEVPVTSTKQSNNKEEEEDENVYPRKRKFKTKSETITSQPTTDIDIDPNPVPVPSTETLYEKVPNSFDMFFSLRRKIISRRQSLASVSPKIPQGYKDFLLNTSSYVLQGNTSSTLSVPTLSPPNSVKDKMRDMFLEQEEARYKLRLQHLIEREKLILSIEQEIMREHGRAARAMANQGTPLSACSILRDQEIYNELNADQEEKEKKNRTRYNGRQFISWLQDVDDKYDKIKEKMILRQKQEADSLYAIQKLEWEWRLKELGQCDQAVTPDIDELHVPLVQVTDNFDLLPT